MPVSSVGGVSSSAAAQPTSTLGQEDLLKILVTQLTYQDPLKPVDNQEFIAQLAQFTSLEQTRLLNEKMESLLTFQSVSQSVGLISKTVSFSSDGAQSTTGTVTAVRFSQGIPYLSISVSGSGAVVSDVPLSQVSLVR